MYSLSWCNEEEETNLFAVTENGVLLKGQIPGNRTTPAENIIVRRISIRYRPSELILQEVLTQNRINHLAVLKIRGWYVDVPSGKAYIATEDAPCGFLSDVLETERSGRSNVCHVNGKEVTWNDTKRYICALGIASGMAACYKNRTAHRDLRPTNIMLDENMYPKITSFNYAKSGYDSFGMATMPWMPPIWCAPEVFLFPLDHDPEKADVYSYAITLYEMVAKRMPFAMDGTATCKWTAKELSDFVVKGGRPSWEGTNVDDKIKDLIERCWDQDPKKRPTFGELITEENRSIFALVSCDVDLDEWEEYEKKAMLAFRDA